MGKAKEKENIKSLRKSKRREVTIIQTKRKLKSRAAGTLRVKAKPRNKPEIRYMKYEVRIERIE